LVYISSLADADEIAMVSKLQFCNAGGWNLRMASGKSLRADFQEVVGRFSFSMGIINKRQILAADCPGPASGYTPWRPHISRITLIP
jgi:hypothetical protein